MHFLQRDFYHAMIEVHIPALKRERMVYLGYRTGLLFFLKCLCHLNIKARNYQRIVFHQKSVIYTQSRWVFLFYLPMK